MPAMYKVGEYDVAGFTVGAAERNAMLPRTEDLAAGDVLLGLASDGVHSNGFSLVRRVLASTGFRLDSNAPFAVGAFPSFRTRITACYA